MNFMEQFTKGAWILAGICWSVVLVLIILIFIKERKLIINYIKSDYRKESKIKYSQLHEKGTYGEFLTFVELEKFQHHKKIVVNPYLPRRDKTTSEIDLVFINATGIYVIESKNFSGSIYGKESDFNWTQFLGKWKKPTFYNPIKQNDTHIKVLQNNLDLPKNISIFSIIIFSDKCKLKVVSSTPVIHRKDLINEINEAYKMNKHILTDSQIDEIYKQLKKYTNASKKVKKQHIQNIKEKY